MRVASTVTYRFAIAMFVSTIVGSHVPAVRAGQLPVVNCAARNSAIDPHKTFWDVSQDFSNSCNPTGPWRYGSTQTLGGSAFATFSQTGTITFQVLDGAVGQWVGTYVVGGQFYPYVAKYYGDPGTTVSVVGGDAQQDDDEQILIQSRANGIVMHPAPPTLGYSVIRWTAPKSATYVVSASFFSAEDDGGTVSATTDVHVQRNHVSLFDGTVSQVGVVDKFSTGPGGIALTQGDVIDFVLGPGADYFGDSTSVEAQVQLAPQVLGCSPGSSTYKVIKPSNTVSANVSANASGTPSVCAVPSSEPASWFIKTTTDGGATWQWVATLGSLGLGK